MIENVRMDCVRPFNIATTVRGIQKEEAKSIRNVVFNHVRGTATKGSLVIGRSKGYVENITFSDVVLDYGIGENIVERPENSYGEFVSGNPPCAFWVENAENISFKDVKVNFPAEAEEWKYAICAANAQGLFLKETTSVRPFNIEGKEI